jgi:hypothetical protein
MLKAVVLLSKVFRAFTIFLLKSEKGMPDFKPNLSIAVPKGKNCLASSLRRSA